ATVNLFAPASSTIPHDTNLAVTLYHDLPYIDLEWRIEHKTPDPWPEAGWLCFPFAIDQPNFRLGRVGSITDPTTDIVPNTNHHIACLNTGLTITDSTGAGIGLCSPDAPLVSLDQPGIWRFSREFTP